jgi:hypothetical protein
MSLVDQWDQRVQPGVRQAGASQGWRPGADAGPAAPKAPRLIEERPGLRPKTIELYRYLLRSHLDPAFSARAGADTKGPNVRPWRKNLLDAQVSAVTVAKAYRLLKASSTPR